MKCEDYPMQCPPWSMAFKGPQPTSEEEENMLIYINNRRNQIWIQKGKKMDM
jgi:hypothetical protein